MAEPLLTQIRRRYGELSPSERKIADLLLNFPGELAGYSASELARIAATSNAAVSRFVRRLGFQNYEEMRRTAREERDRGAPMYLLHKGFEAGTLEPGAEPARATPLGAHVARTAENLAALAAGTDGEALEAFAAALGGARRVWVAGFRHSYFLAGYFRWQLSHVRADVRLLPVGGETLGEQIVDLGPGDVVVVFAFRRRTASTVRLLAAAAAAGAVAAVIADPAYIDAGAARFVFRCPVANRGPFDDHAAGLVLSHVVVESVTARLGRAARDRLVEIDGRHAELAELENGGAGRGGETG